MRIRRLPIRRRFLSTAVGKLGFIGLGNMGYPMATQMAKKGFEMAAYDVDRARVLQLKQSLCHRDEVREGAVTPADGLQLLTSQCSAIVTMLPGPDQVKEVYGELLSSSSMVKPGTLLMDCSTIDPHTSRDLSRRAGTRGAQMIDAPVSGGVQAAGEGKLSFMVGGEPGDVEAARPYLTAMGTSVLHCGAAGAGCIAKLANNVALAVSMVGISEAMNLGIQVLAGVLNAGTARCWSSDSYNPHPGVLESAPSSRGYEGGFSIRLMLKDLTLALRAGKAAGLPLAQHTAQLYSSMCEQGMQDKDFSAIYQFLKEKEP